MDRFWVFRLGNGPQGRYLGLKIQGVDGQRRRDFPMSESMSSVALGPLPKKYETHSKIILYNDHT